MFHHQYLFVAVVVIIFKVDRVGGSECCNAYTDNNGFWQTEQWCADYCCYKNYGFFMKTNLNDRECCGSFLRQVAYYQRRDSCQAWWSDHAWVPALIGIGCIAAITLCCFGCFKLCTHNNNRTGVVVTNPNQPGVVMMSMQGQSQQQSYVPTQNQPMYPPPGPAYPAYPAQPPPYVDNTSSAKAGL